MPNSRARSDMASPSSRRATKRRRRCIAEHSFQAISTSRQKAQSVTHVSGTKCHLCLGSLNQMLSQNLRKAFRGRAHAMHTPIECACLMPRRMCRMRFMSFVLITLIMMSVTRITDMQGHTLRCEPTHISSCVCSVTMMPTRQQGAPEDRGAEDDQKAGT